VYLIEKHWLGRRCHFGICGLDWWMPDLMIWWLQVHDMRASKEYVVCLAMAKHAVGRNIRGRQRKDKMEKKDPGTLCREYLYIQKCFRDGPYGGRVRDSGDGSGERRDER